MSLAGRVGDVLVGAAAVFLVLVAVAMGSGVLSVQPVLSGSMQGTVERGDLLVAARTSGLSVEVGDVIVFAPPAPYTPPGGRPVVHRVIAIDSRDGARLATTKGDANPNADP